MSNFKIGKLKSGNYAIKSEVQYVYMGKPDFEFNKEGEYKITHLVDEEAKAQIEALFQPMIDEHFEEVCKKKPAMRKQATKVSPVKEIYDSEGDVVGYKITPKQDKFIKYKGETIEIKVKLLDGKGHPLPNDIIVGNGSVVVTSFEAKPYFMESNKTVGVYMRPKQSKVLEFVEYGGADELDEFESDFDSSGMKGTPQSQPNDDDGFGDDVPFDTDDDGDDYN